MKYKFHIKKTPKQTGYITDRVYTRIWWNWDFSWFWEQIKYKNRINKFYKNQFSS